MVTVAMPATPVLVPAPVAAELLAAVGAALGNVAEHAGTDGRAWVLLEDEEKAVTVTVRDEGIGMAPTRLAEAEADGRLGVAQSIRGRRWVVRRSTATSCRSTRSSAFLEADDGPSRTSQPQSRTKMR